MPNARRVITGAIALPGGGQSLYLEGRYDITLEFLPTNAGMGGNGQKYICLGIIPELNPDMNAWLII